MGLKSILIYQGKQLSSAFPYCYYSIIIIFYSIFHVFFKFKFFYTLNSLN